MAGEPTTQDLPRILRAFLAGEPTLSLATVDGRGAPHAANVNFVADDDLNLFFLSSPDSDHSRHVEDRLVVAATCYAPFDGPDGIHGVQIHGECHACDPGDFEDLWRRLLMKFPYAAPFEEFSRHEHRFYRIRPTWLRWIDNSVHFGFKLESEWPMPEA